MSNKTEKAALLALLVSVFAELHPTCDQWCQGPEAGTKGLYGDHLVYLDGTPAADEDRPGARTMTATALGQRSATIHVLKYSAGQLVATVAATRATGWRLPVGALAAGVAINGVTHWIIDRRRPLRLMAKWAKKDKYLAHATVVRKPGGAPEESGPGTALMELDQAAHRAIGVVAALITTALATSSRRAR